jgi:putative PIN family toxin of toxin-antitoxin system
MPEKKLRVIFDTNLWISFLINNYLSPLDDLLKRAEVEIALSDQLISEFLDVSKRQKFKPLFDPALTLTLLTQVTKYSIFIEVTSNVNICRDAKDNFLLELSQDSSAEYLITGDKDLLELKRFRRTRIITFTEFLKIMNESS